jgi:hypothetical protein
MSDSAMSAEDDMRLRKPPTASPSIPDYDAPSTCAAVAPALPNEPQERSPP